MGLQAMLELHLRSLGRGFVSSWKGESRVIEVCECRAGDGAHADLGRSQCVWGVRGCVCVCVVTPLNEGADS